MSASDRVQKASAAGALLIIALFGVLVIYGGIKGFFDSRAKSRELGGVVSEVERLEASSDPAALKSKKIIELAYSSWDAVAAVDAGHSQNYTLNRVREHVQSGFQQTDPLSLPIFDKAAEATCIIRVKQVDESSATFERDNYTAYQNAKSDLETWRPYVTDYDKVWKSCAYRFQFMQARYEKKRKEKSVSMREIGAKAGEATREVGKWWDSATKPLSDAVDEFKSGYNSGK